MRYERGVRWGGRMAILLVSLGVCVVGYMGASGVGSAATNNPCPVIQSAATANPCPTTTVPEVTTTVPKETTTTVPIITTTTIPETTTTTIPTFPPNFAG